MKKEGFSWPQTVTIHYLTDIVFHMVPSRVMFWTNSMYTPLFQMEHVLPVKVQQRVYEFQLR